MRGSSESYRKAVEFLRCSATVEALMSDLKKLKKAVEDAAAEAQSALTRAQQTANDLTAQGRAALAGEVLAKAQDAATTATNLVGGVVNAADGVLQAIIDAQATRTQRLAAADWVVYNDDGVTIETLHAYTDQIAAWFGL